MDVSITDRNLDRLDSDPSFTAGLPADAVETFHDVIQHIWASVDELDLLSPRWLEVQQEDARVVSVALSREYRLELELGGDVVYVHALVSAQGGAMSYG